MLTEARCCNEQILVGLTRPIPPSLAGRLSRSRIESLGGLWPEMAGINLERMWSSSGWRAWSTLGTVRHR